MSLLSAQNLTMDFAGKVVFRDISFDINAGEHVGLIGANGTGKTTLFKLITGEYEPTEGGLFISKTGRPLSNASRKCTRDFRMKAGSHTRAAPVPRFSASALKKVI